MSLLWCFHNNMANLEHAEDDQKREKMSSEVVTVSPPGQPGEVQSSVPDKVAAVVACCIPSFAAASELLSAPYSCLVMNTHRRHISLPPMYLNKKRTGIRQELGADLLKFSQSLKGVPLAYEDIRIVGQHGAIYDDSGYIHMDIEANFIVFQPKKGQNLLGRVNKLGVGHVGCLVHGCFNASIPKPNLVSVDTWRDVGPKVGTELEFEVMALDANAVGVLLIRGRLDRTRVQELLAMGESSESGVTADLPEPPDVEPTPEPAEESVDAPPKKKKKKKKDKVQEEVEEVVAAASPCRVTPALNGTMGETNGNDAAETTTKKKKKKKKKEKHVKEEEEEEEEVEVSCKELHGSDSSGYHSDKHSKKRKHEVTSSSHEDPEPKLKKKRKSGVEKSA